MPHQFYLHTEILTKMALDLLRSYSASHGWKFDPKSLDQLPIKLEDLVAQILMFGADYWPQPEKASSNVLEFPNSLMRNQKMPQEPSESPSSSSSSSDSAPLPSSICALPCRAK